MSFSIERRVAGDVGVLAIRGAVDASTAHRMEADLRAQMAEGRKKIVIVLSEVSFMSSAGWGLLLGMIKELRSGGGTIVISGMSQELRQVYNLLGMRAFLKEFPGESDAIAAYAK